jgi:hypothetical protein
MHIPPADIEDAVLTVFRRMRVAPGGTLCHSTLVKSWPRTRLRRDDLDTGLSRLTGKGALRIDDSGEVPLVTLTHTGYARICRMTRFSLANLGPWLRLTLLPLQRVDSPRAYYNGHRRLVDRMPP